MAHSVFLSYSQKDKAAAVAVCNALEANEVRVWMAPRDVVPGAKWAESIPAAIDNARVMVVIFSQSANSSEYIPLEIGRAFSKRLTIIPFRIENAEAGGSLEFFTSSSQWFDAFPAPLEPHLTKFVATVRNSLGMPPQAYRPPAKAPTKKPAVEAPISRTLAPAAARPNFFADAIALAPTGFKLPQLLAGIGAFAALAAVGVFVIYLNGVEPASLPIPIPPDQLPETDCSKLTPPCSNEAGADESALPGMEEISGFATVLSVSALEIKGTHIELAYVEPASANSAKKKLEAFIGWYGPSVRCRPAPIRGKYLCDVGQAHKDLTTQVLHEHWAKPTADAPPELSRN
jgi:TIR domain